MQRGDRAMEESKPHKERLAQALIEASKSGEFGMVVKKVFNGHSGENSRGGDSSKASSSVQDEPHRHSSCFVSELQSNISLDDEGEKSFSDGFVHGIFGLAVAEIEAAATSIVQDILDEEADVYERRTSMMTPDCDCWEYEVDSAGEMEEESDLKHQDAGVLSLSELDARSLRELVKQATPEELGDLFLSVDPQRRRFLEQLLTAEEQTLTVEDIVRKPLVPSSHSSMSSLPAALESSPYLCSTRPDGKSRNPRARRHRKYKRAAEVSAPPPLQARTLPATSLACRQHLPGKAKTAGDMPEWLRREAKAASESVPMRTPVPPPPPPAGSKAGGIRPVCFIRPSEDLDMYSRPVELPWKQKPKCLSRGRKSRPPWQDANDNRSLSPAPRSLSAGKPPCSLPKLAGEEQLSAWRESMVNSAMQLARSCDVPIGLLPKAGAFVL